MKVFVLVLNECEAYDQGRVLVMGAYSTVDLAQTKTIACMEEREIKQGAMWERGRIIGWSPYEIAKWSTNPDHYEIVEMDLDA